MVWVEHPVGRPFMAPPPIPVIVTLWVWLRMVPRAPVSFRVVTAGPPCKLLSCLHLGYPVLGISHTCVPAGRISVAHTRKRLGHFLILRGRAGVGLLGGTRVGLSSCSSRNPSVACLPACLPAGIGRETAAGQAGPSGRGWSENPAPWLCHFGVLGSWPQSGTETLQLET